MPEVSVSVRDLVAFCHRAGDIDHRFTPSPTAEEGTEGHQKIYRRRPASYLREHPVEYRHRQGDIQLLVRGRADGYDPQQVLLEEIKTCRVAFSDIPASVSRQHLAQARVYAAIVALEQGLDELEVRLTWFNIDSEEEYSESEVHSGAQLRAFLQETLERFSDWLAVLAAVRHARDVSLHELDFPHGDFRPGQREIAELVYKCIDQGGELMMEAPTGIGKTVAVMYPALKAVGLGKHEGLVFATSRTVGRRAAEECLALMASRGLRASGLSLTAKDRICFSPGKACHGEDCPFARGYYDRLPAALSDALQAASLRRQDVERIARLHEVCPYQLADDLLPWVDIVIADLHYLYSLYPKLASRMEQDPRRFSVLLDEAHNLPERARGMYSARLSKRELMRVKKAGPAQVRRALERINRAMLALQREDWPEGDLDSRETLPDKLVYALADFVALAGEQMARDPVFLQLNPELMDFYFKVLQWLRVAEHWGEEFRLELDRGRGPQGLSLAINCLDPSRLLRDKQSRLHALVAFSATLSPAPWMQAMLGLGEAAVCRRMASPFEPGQLEVVLASDVDTRYRARAQSLPRLAAMLQHWLSENSGNSIVYFPSYRYMQDCLEILNLTDRTVWQQQSEQSEEERQTLLQLLQERRDVAAFCILGGVFGEGIDLPGEQLSCVVVVGVGLPQVGRERDQLRSWYQQRYGTGFEYAYLYPGMQKVDQALGRVVRTHTDRGRALLVDTRYEWRQYRDLLPPWWEYKG
jgi:DNA excision repair protein ERCC-2